MSLHDAVAKYVENGDVLATGGFTTNRKPYAAVSEILRQGQKDFIVYAGPGGGEVDMLIGEGRVAAYINCYTANSGYTNVSRRFRAAIEKGQLTYEDYSQDVLMLMLHASSLGLPFLPVRLMQGSGLMKYWGISEEKRKKSQTRSMPHSVTAQEKMAAQRMAHYLLLFMMALIVQMQQKPCIMKW